MFKRLLFLLLVPIGIVLTGLQFIYLVLKSITIWVVKGTVIDVFRVETLIDKMFKLIEEDENN